MSEKGNLKPGKEDQSLEEVKLNLQSGLLGRFFGGSSNAPLNIGGLVAILLVVSGMVYPILPSGLLKISPLDYWGIISPIITLILGYALGQNKKD